MKIDIQNIEFMEKQEIGFAVAPTSIVLNEADDSLRFTVKNKSSRSCHYEIFTPDVQHFRIVTPRTFTLAPGITKLVKIQHRVSIKCNFLPQLIYVVDTYGRRVNVQCQCFEQQHIEVKKIEVNRDVQMERVKVGEEKILQIPVRNVCAANVKIRANYCMAEHLQGKISFKMEEEQLILLKGGMKKLKLALKLLKQVEFQFWLILQCIQEETRNRWQQNIRISGNSLMRSQFVADSDLNRVDFIHHEMLNGTHYSGSVFLINNYHEQCPYKLLEVVEITDYKSYLDRLDQITLRLVEKEGSVDAKGRKQVHYTLETRPNQQDLSFTSRYSQLTPKDEASSYKLRNSNYFKKNLEILIRVQFGEDNPLIFKLKVHVVNPALKISKTVGKASDSIQIVNDSGMEVPYKFNSNLYYNIKNQKGRLKLGINSLEVEWRKEESSKSKQNSHESLKCTVKMQIPKNQIIIYEPVALSRPKTALLRNASVSKESLRERISVRAPSRAGQVGVRGLKEVNKNDFIQRPARFIKGEEFGEDQFKCLEINQNEKGNIVTNSHKSKKVVAYFPEKGYLVLENQHSYLFAFQKKSLKFQLSGRAFLIKSLQIEDKNPYKITKKELLFCFSQTQREFDIVREVEVANKSNEQLTMYCLSVDDEYFHSLEIDHKISIAAKATRSFRLSFLPKAEMRLRQCKVMRNIEFLINNSKETIVCEGDFLSADIQLDQKELNFKNCRYSAEEVTKQITLINKGLNKVSFLMQHSDLIKITPLTGSVAQKCSQIITISFVSARLPKHYQQDIKMYIKGSHLLTIPLKVNTLQPDIQCLQQTIDFGEGYINETLSATITILNRNPYACTVNMQSASFNIQGPRSAQLQPQERKSIDLKFIIRQAGEKCIQLPYNFIELVGYGAIKGPHQYCYTAKKTLLQITPQNPFQNLVFSQIQQTKSFKIKNLSKSHTTVKLVLSPQPQQHMIIVSCEPNVASLAAGQERQFKLYSIRVDEEKARDQPSYSKFNLSLFINSFQLYRSIDFQICLPPPQLEISPKNVYFPLVAVGTWSKCSFKIVNKGYKEVLMAIKKPVNIAFELDYKLQKDNRLTKLNNVMEVAVLFKSKKTVSFGVALDIEDNFGKKYQVKLFGTSSNSPLLNCERTISSSSKGFSSMEIRSASSSPSFNSSAFFENSCDDIQNARFLNKWLYSILPEFCKDSQNFNTWLRNPKHLSNLLIYLRCEVSLQGKEEFTIESIVEELKKSGFPLYTVQVDRLMEGDQGQWALFLWLLLSHETVSIECLKWVNKTCGIHIQTYENAYNHHKKILVDLFARLFSPIFKGKVTEWQKIIQFFEPCFPILSKIDNKRQFILVLNILYHKFSKMQKNKLLTSLFQHDLQIESDTKETKSYWLLANNGYEAAASSNAHNLKYSADKKTLNLLMEGSGSLSVKIKDDVSLVLWNNSLYDHAVLYELQINKKAPHIHTVSIECEDKCSQEWKLEFLCEFQAEYFFEFSGGMEFKCKMPDLGIIKSGQILQFRVIYSPSNLKEHSAVLKISNKYEEHAYNLKGKPLRSNLVELERLVKLPQGQKYTETFSIAEDPAVCSELSFYKVTELGEKSAELKSGQAKSNKKEIIVQIVLEFTRVVHQEEILLQIANEELTFCKNIRLIINVIPKPAVVQAQIRGIIDKVICQKIPITNPLPTKQNCIVTLHKITKEECLCFNRASLQQEQANFGCNDKGDWEFKLSHTGKISLKPQEKINVQLSYTPVTLSETCCQIRIKMEGSQNIIVYNFIGLPELPYTDNPPILLTCEAEQSFSHSIKLSNRLKQRVSFDVQTNLSFMAGPEQISIGSRQNYNYCFQMLALHSGRFEGQLIFKSDKFYLVYPIIVTVVSRKKIRKIKIQSKIRVTSTIEIELANRSDRDVQYDVHCNSAYLTFNDKLLLPANSEKALVLHYTPLFQGTRMAELKLFNEHMQEIVYALQMVSEPHTETCNFTSELAEKKRVTIHVKNPTSVAAHLQEPRLPMELKCQLKPDQFPVPLPAYGSVVLELIYTQLKLQKLYSHAMELCTAQIGNFSYELNFTTAAFKKVTTTIVHYESTNDEQTIEKECFLQFLNCYDEHLSLKLLTPFLQLNPHSKMKVEGTEDIELKPYEKRQLKCQILIDQGQLKQSQSNGEDSCKSVVLECKEFSWMFPVQVVRVISMPIALQITGSSHELAKTRISLKKIKSIKDWVISDFPDFRQSCHLSFISSREVYLEAIINKNFHYSGSVTFYDQDMGCAQKYPLTIKIGGRKYEKIWIAANVGEKGRVEIRLKNGRGHYKVELRNNKMKEFGVEPMEGDFTEKGDNAILFEYSPTEYNGNKKAEVSVTSDSGCFNFFLMGKFPPSK